MKNVPPFSWCLLFKSKQKCPMSILISVKGCWKGSCDFIWPYPALRTSANHSDWRWHICKDDLGFTWIMVALSVKVRMQMFNDIVPVNQSKQFHVQFNLGLSLHSLIFWHNVDLKRPLRLSLKKARHREREVKSSKLSCSFVTCQNQDANIRMFLQAKKRTRVFKVYAF